MTATAGRLETDEGVRPYWEQAREAAQNGWGVFCCTVVVGRTRGTRQLDYQEPSRLIHVLEQSGWTLDRLDYLWIQEDAVDLTSTDVRGRVEARLMFRRPIEDAPAED